jgi:hypothetical protein
VHFYAVKKRTGVGRRQQVNPQSRDKKDAALKLLQLLNRRSTGFFRFTDSTASAPGIEQDCPLLWHGLAPQDPGRQKHVSPFRVFFCIPTRHCEALHTFCAHFCLP